MASEILILLNLLRILPIGPGFPNILQRVWTVITGCSVQFHKFKDLSVRVRTESTQVWTHVYLVILQW